MNADEGVFFVAYKLVLARGKHYLVSVLIQHRMDMDQNPPPFNSSGTNEHAKMLPCKNLQVNRFFAGTTRSNIETRDERSHRRQPIHSAIRLRPRPLGKLDHSFNSETNFFHRFQTQPEVMNSKIQLLLVLQLTVLARALPYSDEYSTRCEESLTV